MPKYTGFKSNAVLLIYPKDIPEKTHECQLKYTMDK